MYKFTKFFLLIFFLCNWIYVSNANTATINAKSCSQSDVQEAINFASDGDIVKVPAGNCTWTTLATNTPCVDLYGKKITILGNGIGSTVITDSTGSGFKEQPFFTQGVDGKPFRISGFSFDGTSDFKGVIHIEGTCKNWRIDHCEFIGLDKAGITVWGYTYGVIDNCTFTHNTAGDFMATIVNGDGDTAWARDLTLGTDKAVYVEDCTFNFTSNKGDSAIQGNRGGRYVFRYNTVNGTGIDAHGACSSPQRGTFSYEVYENVFGGNSRARCISLRGGTGVVFNNTMDNCNNPMVLLNYRTCFVVGCEPYTLCRSPWNNRCTTWPCQDQIGRSTDTETWGGVALDGQNNKNTFAPLYEWGNTIGGIDADFEITTEWSTRGCSSPSLSDHIQENRDYYNDIQRPTYTPYTYPHPLTKPFSSSIRFSD